MRERYGLTFEDIEQIKVEQNHVCAVCSEAAAEDVDHCHTTGKVRGLVCASCNQLVRYAERHGFNEKTVKLEQELERRYAVRRYLDAA